MTIEKSSTGRNRWVGRAGLLTRILLAVAFAWAGFAKLSGAAAMVDVFEAIGVGQWFRLFTGAVELVAAVLILIPSVAWLGAGLLAATMVGAVFTHLAVIGGSPAPAVVLLALSLFALWTRRRDLPFGLAPTSGANT